MKRSFDPSVEADLGLWEAGELTLDELERRHPEEDIRGLVSVWSSLNTVRYDQTPEPWSRWVALRTKLGEQTGERATPVVTRLRRVAVVGGIAAVLMAGTAIAYGTGSPPVRDAVDGMFNRFSTIFVAESAETTPDPTREPTTQPQRPAPTSQQHTASEQTTSTQPDSGQTTSLQQQPPPQDFEFEQGEHPQDGWQHEDFGPYATQPPRPTPPPPYQDWPYYSEPTPSPSPEPTPSPTPESESSPSPRTSEDPSSGQ